MSLLRARRQRPRGSRAAKQRDELAANHSITSSAISRQRARERSAARLSRARGGDFSVCAMLLLIAAIGTTRMACDEGRQAFTPPRGPFSLHQLIAPVPIGPPAWTFKGFVQMARKQWAEQWAEHRRQRDEEDRQQRVMVITEFGAGDPEATMHALADEVLRFRHCVKQLSEAIGWASTGAPFGLMGQSSQQIAMTTGFWVRICASSPC